MFSPARRALDFNRHSSFRPGSLWIMAIDWLKIAFDKIRPLAGVWRSLPFGIEMAIRSVHQRNCFFLMANCAHPMPLNWNIFRHWLPKNMAEWDSGGHSPILQCFRRPPASLPGHTVRFRVRRSKWSELTPANGKAERESGKKNSHSTQSIKLGSKLFTCNDHCDGSLRLTLGLHEATAVTPAASSPPSTPSMRLAIVTATQRLYRRLWPSVFWKQKKRRN